MNECFRWFSLRVRGVGLRLSLRGCWLFELTFPLNANPPDCSSLVSICCNQHDRPRWPVPRWLSGAKPGRRWYRRKVVFRRCFTKRRSDGLWWRGRRRHRWQRHRWGKHRRRDRWFGHRKRWLGWIIRGRGCSVDRNWRFLGYWRRRAERRTRRERLRRGSRRFGRRFGRFNGCWMSVGRHLLR